MASVSPEVILQETYSSKTSGLWGEGGWKILVDLLNPNWVVTTRITKRRRRKSFRERLEKKNLVENLDRSTRPDIVRYNRWLLQVFYALPRRKEMKYLGNEVA